MLASSRYDITMGCVMVMMMRMTITQHQWLWFIGFRTALSSFVVLVLYSQKDRGASVCACFWYYRFFIMESIYRRIYIRFTYLYALYAVKVEEIEKMMMTKKNESCLTPIWKTYMFCRHRRQRTSKEMICVQKIFLVYWLDIYIKDTCSV